MISNVWYPFYNHSPGAHYGNFSSITGKLYNKSDDKLASQAEICILIQLSKSFPHVGPDRTLQPPLLHVVVAGRGEGRGLGSLPCPPGCLSVAGAHPMPRLSLSLPSRAFPRWKPLWGGRARSLLLSTNPQPSCPKPDPDGVGWHR